MDWPCGRAARGWLLLRLPSIPRQRQRLRLARCLVWRRSCQRLETDVLTYPASAVGQLRLKRFLASGGTSNQLRSDHSVGGPQPFHCRLRPGEAEQGRTGFGRFGVPCSRRWPNSLEAMLASGGCRGQVLFRGLGLRPLRRRLHYAEDDLECGRVLPAAELVVCRNRQWLKRKRPGCFDVPCSRRRPDSL